MNDTKLTLEFCGVKLCSISPSWLPIIQTLWSQNGALQTDTQENSARFCRFRHAPNQLNQFNSGMMRAMMTPLPRLKLLFSALFFIPKTMPQCHCTHFFSLPLWSAEISTDQKFEACRKQLRLIGLVASIDPERALSESSDNMSRECLVCVWYACGM